MPAELHHRDGAEIALPRLSDDAVVQIHGFIEQVLASFESRYADQIRRFYDGMREDNIINGSDRHEVDDPPF
jgi:hypothetical protein